MRTSPGMDARSGIGAWRRAACGVACGILGGAVGAAGAEAAMGGDGPAVQGAGNGVAHGVDLLPLRTVLHDDVRVLWMGDSFSIPYGDRPSAASLLSWRMDAWTGFSTGDGPSWFCARFEELTPGINTVWGSSVYRLTPDETGVETRFGLPLWRLRELVMSPGATEPIEVMRYRMRPYIVAAGESGRFVFPGETATVRPVLLDRPGSAASVGSITISGSADGPVSFDPRTQTRPKRMEGNDPATSGPTAPADGQIFAAPSDVSLVANSSSEIIFTLSATPDETAAMNVVLPAGFVTYRGVPGSREPGLYFSAIADGSWSYSGFGADAESGTPGFSSKVFSRDQLAHWLDATTLDPQQPLVVFHLLAVEDISQANAKAAMEAMIDQTAAAAQAAGIGSVRHCLVIPWLHRVDGADNPGRFPEQRDAAFEIAAARASVSAISIYDATDAQMFDGNPASRAWLAANGYDAFRYGTKTVDLSADGGGSAGGLLDAFRSHPGSIDGAAFFAHIIEKTFVDACPADFASPYGVLDLADINGFITRFVDQAASADIAPPRGQFDLSDLNAFIGSFLSGCAQDG